MRLIKTLLIALPMLVMAVPAHSVEPTTDSIRKLLEVTGAAEMGEQMFAQVGQAMQPPPSVSDEQRQKFTDMMERMRQEVDFNELIELVIPIYQKHLTQDVVDSAIEFYSSTNGSALIGATPVITQESFTIGSEWGRDIAMKIQQEMQNQQ